MSVEHHTGGGVLGLDAVILIADDFVGQCNFYRDVLGLDVSSLYADAAFLRVGRQTLGIFARSHHPEGTKRLRGASHGISHLEFRLAEVERQQLVSGLDAAGARAYGENFADADGNLFHFNYS